MLEKFITNLKNSLPGPLRKKMGMGDENDEEIRVKETEENELQKYESIDVSAEDKKKKSISMLIRVVIILILAYMAVDEFVLSKNKGTASVDNIDAQIAKAEAKRKKKREESKAKAKEAGDAAGASKEAPAITGDQDAIASTTASTSAQVLDTPAENNSPAPIENVNVLDKSNPPATAPMNTMAVQSQAEKPAEIVSSKIVDTSVDNKIDQLVENVNQSTGTRTAVAEEVQIPSQKIQTAPEQISAEKNETSMASKIVEEVTETPAPAYDHVGRGLVYNCKDKYWACVDKSAYVNCNKNMKWNKSKGSAAECVIQNIYSTDEDCAKIQKYNVSTIQPTTFCQ